MTKREAERVHSKRRAAERYGLSLNRKDLREIVKLIQTGTARCMARQSCRVTLWEIPFNQTVLYGLYDSKRSTVITFLPPDADEVLADKAA